MGFMRNVAASVAVSVAVSVVLTSALNSSGLVQVPDGISIPAVEVPQKVDRSTQETEKIVRAACAGILAPEKCKTFPVVFTKLPEGQAGAAEYTAFTSTHGGSSLRPDRIKLDSALLTENDTYVSYVAAHEWHHVRQYMVARTPENLDRLSHAANEYFQPRAAKGVNLASDDGGLELLTDCSAVFGSKRDPGPWRKGITPYVCQYLKSSTMVHACGNGWVPIANMYSKNANPAPKK